MTEDVIKKVDSIRFNMLSPQAVKKISVAKIVTPELYDREGYPVDGGLMDIRMGVIDPGLRCKTCGAKLKECPGHFGYMELARPVLHIKYLDEILTELEQQKVSQFIMDEDMKRAVKKVLLYHLYYSGTVKKGIDIDPMENCALIYANNPKISDKEMADYSRAVYQGLNALELGFSDLERYKLEEMPKLERNPAR